MVTGNTRSQARLISLLTLFLFALLSTPTQTLKADQHEYLIREYDPLIDTAAATGAMGEFHPVDDLELTREFVVQNYPAALREWITPEGAHVGAVFDFSQLVIPKNVTVEIRDLGSVIFRVSQAAIIQGTIVNSGTGGGSGGDGVRSAGRTNGVRGGDGGDGGDSTEGLGIGGFGTGGIGGFGTPGTTLESFRTGPAGSNGSGSISSGTPNHAQGPTTFSDCPFTRGGGGGGSGTGGASDTLGFAPRGASFGSIDFSVLGADGLPAPIPNLQASGGGAGGWGGCPDFSTFASNPLIISFVATGGSGGGGGGGGGLVCILSGGPINVSGRIAVDGGWGGDGGSGNFNLDGSGGFIYSYAGGGGGGGAGGYIFLRGSSVTMEPGGLLSAIGGYGGLSGNAPLPSRIGSTGGAGGGGRINIFATNGPDGQPRVFGISPSNGSPASGRTGTGQPTVFIGGFSARPAPIEVQPESLVFSGIINDTQPSPQTLTLANPGSASVNFSIATNVPNISISPGIGTLSAGGSAEVMVLATNNATASLQSGELTISTTDLSGIPVGATRRVAITAITADAAMQPTLAVSPGTLTFDATTCDLNPKVVIVANLGGGQLDARPSPISPFIARRIPTRFSLNSSEFAAVQVSIDVAQAQRLVSPDNPTAMMTVIARGGQRKVVNIRVRTVGRTERAAELSTDDGSIETGCNCAGSITVVRITPVQYPATLRCVRVQFLQFPDDPDPAGQQVRIVAFTDPTGSGQPPTAPTFNADFTATIGPFTGLDLEAFQSFVLPQSLTINSGDFYVGFQSPDPQNGVLVGLDLSEPQGREFISTDRGRTFRPGGEVIMDQNGQGLPSNFMIRGVVVTPR